MLKEGATLSAVIESIRIAHGVAPRILPMSDSFVPTMLQTNEGRMHLQDYFVRRRCEPRLEAIAFDGVERALAAPGVIDCIRAAETIVIAPSNPLISIGPILAVPGIRDTLRANRARVIAVSPLVGGKSLKGPSDKMMREMGHEVSAAGVARLYRDICATFIIDETDADQSGAIEALGMTAVVCPTVMRSLADKEQLAGVILRLADLRA
jgi:LPPG:FO 2-phospho-L-lactate transferase